MFYIDIDLISKCIYIFPIVQSREESYLIQVRTRYEAEQIVRKLKAGLYTPPQTK